MRTLAIIATLALAGCASTQSIVAQDATAVYHSSRHPADVAFCLGSKYSVPVYDGADGAKIVAIKNWLGATAAAMSVYPDGEGSRVEYNRSYGTKPSFLQGCLGEGASKQS
jgi:hypothetical protein